MEEHSSLSLFLMLVLLHILTVLPVTSSFLYSCRFMMTVYSRLKEKKAFKFKNPVELKPNRSLKPFNLCTSLLLQQNECLNKWIKINVSFKRTAVLFMPTRTVNILTDNDDNDDQDHCYQNGPHLQETNFIIRLYH